MSRPPLEPGMFRQVRDGRTYVGRREEICDFCCGPDPVWQFPAAMMPVVGHPHIEASDDDWAACEECKALLEAHNTGALVERIVRVQREVFVGPMYQHKPLPLARREARQNLLRFMDARRGPPRRYR